MEVFFLLLLACFTEAVPSKNMEDQVFLFPKRSARSYVLLNPSQNKEMERLTICLSFYSEMTQDFSLFSAASRDHHNEILLFKVPNGYEVILGDQAVTFKVSEKRSGGQAEDLCLAWDSSTGVVQLWLNRIPLPRKVAAQGYRIKKDLIIMLGQDQDSYGGSLDPNQAFEGELGEVYLWDTLLSADQIRSFQRRENSIPLLDWLDLSYKIHGDVMAVPSLL
ncbi:C-reactive protein-like [Thamnophis elegans]|uniref:C-reactive protein-like n=1 Tax=Thamnophis elegans TaxID=35005 RepID=UPI001377E4A0|nr:C-reactive protein-like [Thamnophis elegans]